MMAVPTIVFGISLTAVGLIGYFSQDSATPSPTALIPAAFGALLIVCGVLAFNDKLRKHVMHFAAMVGLLGAVGGFMPLISTLKKTGGLTLKPSVISGCLTILLCTAFVGLCVKSFIDARRSRVLKAAGDLPGENATPQS